MATSGYLQLPAAADYKGAPFEQKPFNEDKEKEKNELNTPTGVCQVLLIGTTGSGKSSLGNFLTCSSDVTSPDEYLQIPECFPTAKDNKPCSKSIKKETKVFQLDGKKVALHVVDTPGVNESEEKDVQIMIDIVKTLHELKCITACILCVKFQAKLDAQYFRTIQYYQRILPTLFENDNFFVVFTDYSCSDYMIRKREADGIDPDKVIDNSLACIVTHANLRYLPQYYTIDSKSIINDEFLINITKKKSIINHILRLTSVKTCEMLVYKPPKLLEKHRQEATKLRKEIETFSKSVKETQEHAEETQEITDKLRVLISKLDDLDKRKKSFDTEEFIQVGHWQSSIKWSLKPIARSENFCIKSKWPITIIRKNANGYVDWTTIHQTSEKVEGLVTAKVFHGLSCSVTALAYKRDRFKEDIQKIEKEIQNTEEEKRKLDNKLEKFKNHNNHALMKFIAEREEKMKFYLKQLMTINEVVTLIMDEEIL